MKSFTSSFFGRWAGLSWLLLLCTSFFAAKAQTPFVHPGGWHTVADITRVRAALAAGTQPQTNANTVLLASAPFASYVPSPVPVVIRNNNGASPDGSEGKLRADAMNAYTLMVKWMATNDISYANAAIGIIDGWSATLTDIVSTQAGSNDYQLVASIYGNKLAQAAELAAYAVPTWPNKARAQTMFLTVFYPKIQQGASNNFGTAIMAAISSFGVFCDNPTLYNQALDAYRNGYPGPAGCAGVTQYIDATGEDAESGRDQPHAQGGVAHLLELAVTAYNQGDNSLFFYGNNRLQAGLEYLAQFNLSQPVPYAPFVSTCSNVPVYPVISQINRGLFSPIYEMAFNYLQLNGLAAPYSKMAALQYAPEITNADHPGWGTLTFRRDPAPGLLAQTITFPALPTKTYNSPDFSAGATASSGLAVTYSSSNPTVATVTASGQIHIVAGGSATIYAYQLGNATYGTAPIASRTLTVNVNPYVRIEAENFNGQSGAIRTEVTSDVDGDVNLSFVTAGSYTYYSGLDFGSSGPVKFYIRNAIIGAATNVQVRLDALTGTLLATLPLASTGGNQVWRTDSVRVAAGVTGVHTIYLVYGSQINVNWLRFDATPINGLPQTITFPALPAKTTASADFSPGATSSSGLAVTYSSSNTAVANITAGNLIHILTAGTVTITALQNGDVVYNPATSVTQTLTITAATVSAPYKANTVPGIIEAEDYDYGGQGVAYNDITTGQQSLYRPGDRVQSEFRNTVALGSASNGVNLAFTRETEWLNYTLNVQQAATYTFAVRHSSSTAAGTVRTIAVSIDGGAATSFNLLTSGNNATFVTNTFSLPLPAGTHVMRVTFATAGAASSANLDSFTFSTGPVWTGTTSTDWATATNWSTGAVPTATDDVVIPGFPTRQPTVSTAQSVRGLALGAGAVLTTTSTLTLLGDLSNNGGSLAGAGTVALGGASLQTLSGSMAAFQNLTVGSAGATLAGPVQVQRMLTVSGNLASNGNLTLLSNATGTAMVVNNGAAAVTGSVTVQRYIDPTANAGLGYRHYSSPVQSTTVSDLATSSFTPTVNSAYNTQGNTVTPFPTIFGYDETRLTAAMPGFDQGWYSPGMLADALTPGKGYTVNIPGTQTVDFVGTLGNGPLTMSGLTRGTSAAAGWQLLGNPYPAPLNFDLLTLSGLDNALYVFKSAGQYSGSYAAYVNGVGTNGGSNQLAAMQGFFVRTSTAGTPGQLTFSNAARLTTYANPTFNRNTGSSQPLVRLTLQGTVGAADQVAVYFQPGATTSFDPAYDAYQVPAGGTVQLAALAGSEHLIISALPELTSATVIVPLVAETATAGTYTFMANDLLNLPAGLHVYLRDAQTGTQTDLTQQASYACTLVPGAGAGRFSLVFSPQAALATAPASLSQQVVVYPNPAHGTAALALPASLSQQPLDVALLNVLGQTVRQQTLSAAAGSVRELPLAGLAQGVYTVRLQTPAGLVVKRLTIE